MADPRVLLATLPLLWVHRFSFQEGIAVALLALFSLAARRLRRDPGGILNRGLNAAFDALLFAPLLRFRLETWLVFVGSTLLASAIVSVAWKTGSLRSGKGLFPLCLAGSIPLVLGGVPTFLLLLSPQGPPTVMVPLEGWLTAVATILFWLSLCLVPSAGIESGSPWVPRFRFTLMTVLFASLLLRGIFIEKDLRAVSQNERSSLTDWENLLARSRRLNLPLQSDRIGILALRSAALEDSKTDWISLAKDLDPDLDADFDSLSVGQKILAAGGKPWEDELDPAQDIPVALEVNPDSLELTLLTDTGFLFQAGDRVSKRKIESEVGPFVHLSIGFDGDTVALEAGGRLLAVRGEVIEEIIPTHFSPGAAYLIRLTTDRVRRNFWALDKFGVVYRSDLEQKHWLRDERFVPFSKTPDGAFPTAQDLTVSEEGTLHFLNCYGEIWSSSIESTSVTGPDRGAHFFPDFPVAQSLGIHGNRLEMVDRYGGFYFSPYPTDPETLRLRNSHLFPRSLPRREADIVDHVFLPQHRWLYLLTKSGRILTNKRWDSFWAD